METASISIGLVLAAVAVSAISVLRFERATTLLADWAFENGYTLINTQRRSLFRGPFARATRQSQVVYQIVVEDERCHRRSGFARVGGEVAGLPSDEVLVQWDD